MPKIRTHKATSKRFRVTGSGKVKRTVQGKSHFRRNKPQRKINELDKAVVVEDKSVAKRVMALAPWLNKK
jgi:large subunit ribosomal protein L35